MGVKTRRWRINLKQKLNCAIKLSDAFSLITYRKNKNFDSQYNVSMGHACPSVCTWRYIKWYDIWYMSGSGGLEVARWPLVPKFAGSNPAEAVGFLRAKKILSTPSFGGEVKPSVPCRRFAACKRSLELRGNRILGQICRNISRPRRVPPSAARGLSIRWTWRHLAEKVGTSKGGGKKWQPTPNSFPRMQRRSPDWALVPAKPA